MDLQHIRRLNIRRIATRMGGVPQLAAATDIGLDYFYRMLAPTPSKPVSDKMAARIEGKLGLPDGELSSLFAATGQKGQYDAALMSAPQHTMRLITTVLDQSYKIDSEVANTLTTLLNRMK